jgi:hypothetical protein
MYLVFKCLTDTIMLDDFKTELDRLSEKIGAIQTASWPLSLHSRGRCQSFEKAVCLSTARLTFAEQTIQRMPPIILLQTVR